VYREAPNVYPKLPDVYWKVLEVYWQVPEGFRRGFPRLSRPLGRPAEGLSSLPESPAGDRATLPPMANLTGFQRKALRGQAHSLKPLVRIGKQGLTEGALHEIDAALDSHELIKVHAPGTKEEKQDLAHRIEAATDATAVGQIGHVLILYREQADPEKRKVAVPESRGDAEEEAPPAPAPQRAAPKRKPQRRFNR